MAVPAARAPVTEGAGLRGELASSDALLIAALSQRQRLLRAAAAARACSDHAVAGQHDATRGDQAPQALVGAQQCAKAREQPRARPQQQRRARHSAAARGRAPRRRHAAAAAASHQGLQVRAPRRLAVPAAPCSRHCTRRARAPPGASPPTARSSRRRSAASTATWSCGIQPRSRPGSGARARARGRRPGCVPATRPAQHTTKHPPRLLIAPQVPGARRRGGGAGLLARRPPAGDRRLRDVRGNGCPRGEQRPQQLHACTRGCARAALPLPQPPPACLPARREQRVFVLDAVTGKIVTSTKLPEPQVGACVCALSPRGPPRVVPAAAQQGARHAGRPAEHAPTAHRCMRPRRRPLFSA